MSALLTRLLPPRFRRDRTVIPLVRLSGAIGGGGRLNSGLTLASVDNALRKAFSMRKAPLVAIAINSPGGSPVQSHLIHRRIRALAKEKNKPVIVGVEDVAASGGYLIALAADEIVADPSSIVGSIGVVSAGFGFPRLLERIGVERRVHSSGPSKAMLDPFRPEKEEDVARLRVIQDDVYEGFVSLVKERRGKALGDDPDLFTGAFWTGKRAMALGLIDGLGDLRTVLAERYGTAMRLRPIATERNRLMRRLAVNAGPSFDQIAAGALDLVEERLLWSRYGL